MFGYIKRLLKTGAAYQGADIVAKAIALFTLPLYTSHVSPEQYGAYSTLLTSVILASILVRVGVGEAFVRFYYQDGDLRRRERIAKTATATVAWTTTLSAAVLVVFAQPVSKLVLGSQDAPLLDSAVVGLWAFTNLELAYAQLRVDERAGTYLKASLSNVVLTLLITIPLVVFAGLGARGLLLGNFGASGLVVIGLWWSLKGRFSLRVRVGDLLAMLRFGLPTIPADAIVYCLQVVDRFYLFRAYGASPAAGKAAAGQYAIALQLATVVFVFVRGFQYAWPPLAYSIDSEAAAQKLYAIVSTWFVLATGIVVVAATLLAHWLVAAFAAPQYAHAHTALPWLALAWTLYGLYQMAIVITGRKLVTAKNLPAAAVGLAINIVLLLWLVPHGGPMPGGGAGLGIAGAGIALCGAYVGMLLVIHVLTHSSFKVAFEWSRLLRLLVVLGAVTASGELLLPSSGASGFLLRIIWLALIPVALITSRFLSPREVARGRTLVAAAVQFARAAARASNEPPRSMR